MRWTSGCVFPIGTSECSGVPTLAVGHPLQSRRNGDGLWIGLLEIGLGFTITASGATARSRQSTARWCALAVFTLTTATFAHRADYSVLELALAGSLALQSRRMEMETMTMLIVLTCIVPTLTVALLVLATDTEL